MQQEPCPARGVELWEHQGTTRIDWFGTKLSCESNLANRLSLPNATD